MFPRISIHIPALIALLVLLLAVLLLTALLLMAGKDAVLEKVEAVSGVATLVLEFAVAEYQSFATEVL